MRANQERRQSLITSSKKYRQKNEHGKTGKEIERLHVQK
jgi:hypothetical protein